MAKADLTAARLRELLEYSPETGEFRWRIYRSHRARKGAFAGHKTDYARISVDSSEFLAHRLAWLYMTGEWPENLIDHIDGNPFNNSWENLRDVSPSANLENQRRHSLGVSWHTKRKKFVAQIKYGGKNRMIGRFDSFEAAKTAYLDAKNKHHLFSVKVE